MPLPPIPQHVKDAPQPVMPALITPRLDEIITQTNAGLMVCRDTLPDGAITPLAARAMATFLDTIQRDIDAIREAMRLKVQSLDCAATIVGSLPAGGISETALHKRLGRRGFTRAEMRAAITTLSERGLIVRIPDPERPGGKRGPRPMRIVPASP